ncbi:MAG: transcription elongation factor GreA [gamma proteobacterium symbiont of Bathyaustriella thionipta]|nr:transcription elongation factor GreA [gamma proteobacterium symbiont of Bathyaustriella thionipta]MCU7948959.1 transcription elongation factor GreA [gamma proteobacterium symbiont of Bathyaustriella thionipta]MCU7953961.1 transcription elongation factor GreA [gamma proteobacterium symbiont of Bathyaustriella thionipta]MCU7955504.1 transcription elongation factor GreA [gamma proteobacterium symbiont of Bathyaustriella thionipta]MCU7967093.1 transcription elongation factor GreA [gamma proteoba
MNKVPLTKAGADKLEIELKELKSVRRPKVIQAIAEAREHGDLKENAEYHAAREEQGFIEGRIKDIEGKLSNAQIIDVTTMKDTGRVIFGTTVVIYDEVEDKEISYQIVGEDEANIKEGKISVSSPVAMALIGKEVDDVALVKAPGGDKEYEIVDVKYI